MSTFKVAIVKIDDVQNHPGADRLDLIQIADWKCVSAKGKFAKGDLAIYFPIDSILPAEIEHRIFGIDAKVKLTNSRVRTIKLRGAISQGLVADPSMFIDKIGEKIKEGQDVTGKLGITKYEPPQDLSSRSNVKAVGKKQCNPNFRKYTGIENAKNYPNVFSENDMVHVSCKIHGTNFRCGYVETEPQFFLFKFLKKIGLYPKYEFVYGSHNVQLQHKLLAKTYYETNVYAEAVHKYNLKEILKPGQVVYGEIYGDGIQKGYTYGCKPGERKLVLFDLMVDGKYVRPDILIEWAKDKKLPVVPELYRGPFNKDYILSLRDGPSVLCPEQKVREGVVVRSLYDSEDSCHIGRKILKYISDAYLLKNQDQESIAH